MAAFVMFPKGATMSEKATDRKKRVRGVVKSDRMDKTITVRVERLVKHPRYDKRIRRRSIFMAHNPHGDAREGDLVEIESTRPLSRRKCWRLVRVLRRAPGSKVGVAQAAPASEASTGQEQRAR